MKTFDKLTKEEVAQYERDNDSVVIFDNEIGIAFQKVRCEDPEEDALAISYDVVDQAVILYSEYVYRLKNYLDEKF